MMAGLGILEHDAVGIEGIAGDHGKAVIAPQVQAFPVQDRCPLHGDPALTGNDLHFQLLFQIGINGLFCNFRSQTRHRLFQEIVDIQDQAFPIDLPDTADQQQTASCGKSAFCGQSRICRQCLEPQHLGNGTQVVAPGGFLKGFNAAHCEACLVRDRLVNHLNALQRIMTALAEIFAPLIPAIITGGLILGFRNVIDSLYIFENGTATLVMLSQFWAGVDHFLWLIGEAVFHMLPVGICWSITKKMGTNQMLGIVLGLTLVSGQLLNAYGVNADAVIPQWDFGFIQVDMIGYQAQVIPAMLAGFTLVYLEKFFRKVTPAVISMIVVPFCSLVLAVMAAHFVLGPIGWTIGSWISNFVYAGITGSLRAVFGAVFGTFYAPLVITGLHHMSNAIDSQLCADFGGTMLWPMIALSNIAQGSAVLGMIYLQRKNARAQEVNIPSCISCYLGVTEPAMFGVNLKYNFPFVCAMIGSGIAGVFSVLTSSTANSIGVGGLPGILSMQPQSIGTFAIAMLIAVAVPFVLTVIIGKRKNIA